MACNQNTTPCVPCEEALQSIDSFCEDGCPSTLHTDCMVYDGEDISLPNSVTIENLSVLTDVIKKLSQSNLDIALDVTFSPITRKLCILKNGESVKCVIIPDADDQYLKLLNNKIEIWKPVESGDDIKINDIDLTPILGIHNITSNSLVITNSNNVEFVPSIQAENHITLGSDGKPYSPIQNLVFTNSTNELSITGGNVISLNGFVKLTPLLQQSGDININGILRGDNGIKTGNTITSISKIWKLGSLNNNGHTLENTVLDELLPTSATLVEVIGVVNNLLLQIANINQRFKEFKEYATINVDGSEQYIPLFNKTN